MNRLEEIYTRQRNERLGITIDRLDCEVVQNPAQLIQHNLKQSDEQFRKMALDRYEKVFGCRKLECEGLLGAKLNQSEQNLADVLIDDARARMRGMKLASASITYNQKPLRIWFEITK